MKQYIDHAHLSSIFSFSRFGSLLRRYLIENRKSLLMLSGMIIGLQILVGLSVGNDFVAYELEEVEPIKSTAQYEITESGDTVILNDDESPIEKYRNPSAEEINTNLAMSNFRSLTRNYIIIGWFFLILTASFMFSSLKTRESRLNMLMSPGSMLEKFFVRIFVYNILAIVVFIIGALIGNAFRVLTDPTYLKYFYLDVFNDFVYHETLIVLFLFISIYVLGSALAPKLSFLKTSLFLILCGIISMFSFMMAFYDLFDFIDSELVLELFSMAISLLFYFLAWLKFKNSEIA